MTSAETKLGVTPPDAPVASLLRRIDAAQATTTPDLKAIGAALVDLAVDLDYVGRWVERFGGTAGSLPIHAPPSGPRLMIVHRTEGEVSAVHDHGTWVAISPVVGLETHRRWRTVGNAGAAAGSGRARIELAEELGLDVGRVATLLPPDDLHDHGHLGGAGRPAYVLILLGDDPTHHTRNEWDLATGQHRVLRPGDPGRWLASEPIPDA